MIARPFWRAVASRALSWAARAILALGLASAASAEVLAVRSGEHNGFSRIVISPERQTGWQLGRVGAGYELRLDRPGVTFDLSRAFDLIPKRRLSALSEGTTESSIAFGLACACHAVGFQTAGGAIVVDIVSGPANPDSGFEASLEPAAGQETTAAVSGIPATAAPSIGDAAVHFPFGPNPVAHPGTLSDPAPFWPALTNAGHATSPSPGHTPPDDALRISNTEQDLLFQLGRAAAQGLVTAKATFPDAPGATPGEAQGEAPGPADEHHPAETTSPEAASSEATPPLNPTEDATQRAALDTITSIDRDTLNMATGTANLTPDGAACAPDADFAVATWGAAEDPVAQIDKARAVLIGEFDAPDEAAVVALARLFVSLGFGAEARAYLAAFAVPDDHAPHLRDLTYLVDGEAPGPGSPLLTQSGCESDVSLWAILAAGKVVNVEGVGPGAALRAFAALPPHLRRALGPRLADIFLAAGEADAARTVRNATERASPEADREVSLIDARIDLTHGDTASARDLLDRLSAGNDPTAPEALILGIETRLSRGETVDPLLADAAEALARENRDTPLGHRLARAHALALAANGDVAAAFAALSTDEGLAAEDRRTAEIAIFERIAEVPGEADFLAAMVPQITRFGADRPLPDLQLAVAGRLLAAGLPDQALETLSPETGVTEPGRLLRARAALANFSPETALQVLSGLGSTEAVPLRALAYERIGNDAAAAEAFAAAGQPADSASAALRAGDWTRAAALGSAEMQVNLRDLRLVPDPAPAEAAPNPARNPEQPQATGPIATARNLVTESSATRTAIDALLKRTP